MKKKPNGFVRFIGFIVSLLLFILLLANGILLGLKTTILKGDDLVSVLENANLFETVTEVVVSEISNVGEGTGLGDVAGELLTEDVVAEVAQNVTTAVVNNEEVDLSGMKDTYVESIKTTSSTMVDEVINEITQNGTEISRESLDNNPLVQSMAASYGVDISSMVMGYVEETYGTTTISVDQVDVEAVKQSAQAKVEEVVVPMAEEVMDTYIEQINTEVNETIRTLQQKIDISGILATIEKVIGLLEKIIIALCVVILLFVVIEFLLFKGFTYKAFKNIGGAAMWSGILVALIGGVITFGKKYVMGMVGGSEDQVTQVIIGFVDAHVTTMGNRILQIGGGYIAAALVCLIVGSVMAQAAAKKEEV